MSYQASFFQKLLSYLWDQKIESRSSDYNPQLDLYLSRRRLKLNSKNATYSHEDLYTNFYKAFQRKQFEEKKLEEVLVLGFGLGSIMVMLENNFQQSAHYTGVEIDGEIIALCKKYLEKEMLTNLDLIGADAFEFVFETDQKYDFIAVDVFFDTETPDKFRSKKFLSQLRQLLKPNACLLYNVLAIDREAARYADSFYKNVFLSVFKGGEKLDVSGNKMLYFERADETMS